MRPDIRLHPSSVNTDLWDEAKATMKPALTSALCSVTSKTPWPIIWWCHRLCDNLEALEALSLVSTGKAALRELVVAWFSPEWRSDSSFQRSATSNKVTGTQSLSNSTKWIPGKRKTSAASTKVPTAGSIASELPSGSGGNPSLHVISLGTLCIWDPVGALAFAYQHLLGTEQGQETTTFVFRTVDIWHDLTVLGQESQETPMAQGHQICLQGRLTRLYTHQSSSSTTEASNAGMISWYIII